MGDWANARVNRDERVAVAAQHPRRVVVADEQHHVAEALRGRPAAQTQPGGGEGEEGLSEEIAALHKLEVVFRKEKVRRAEA